MIERCIERRTPKRRAKDCLLYAPILVTRQASSQPVFSLFLHLYTPIPSNRPVEMKLKDISRTATFAWDQSSSSSPLIATGAVAGALDESFSNESQLEIWAPDFSDVQSKSLGGRGNNPEGSIIVNSR